MRRVLTLCPDTFVSEMTQGLKNEKYEIFKK